MNSKGTKLEALKKGTEIVGDTKIEVREGNNENYGRKHSIKLSVPKKYIFGLKTGGRRDKIESINTEMQIYKISTEGGQR